MAQQNLLVDWLNKNNTNRSNMLGNIQASMANKTTATNPTTVQTPNTPITPTITRPQTNLNFKKAQPSTPIVENTTPVIQPGTITGNNPAFVNGKLRPSSTNEVMNAAQSRFIGFQQQQPTYPNTTIGTGQEGKSFEKLYNGGYMRIESNAEKAEKYNKKEEEKFRTTSEALMDFQGDVLKNNGKMTDWQLENRYPEFSDNLDSLKELQNELRPIVQSGMGVDPEQLAEYYPELLKPKKTYSIEAIKKNAAETEKAYENAKKIMDKALTLNVEGLSSNGLKVARDYDTLFNIVDVVKKKHSLGDANNSEILGYLLKNNEKVRELWDEIEASKANLTETDKSVLNRKDANLLNKGITDITTGIIDLAGKGLEKLGLEGNRKATDEEIETAIRAKEKLESDFANQTWKKLAVEINVPLDSLEKFAYRTYKDVQNKILEKGSEYTKEKITKTIKSAFKKELGVDLTDEQVESIRNLYDTAVTPSINQEIQTNQQNVMDYLESVNKEYQNKKGTLDEDIENYTNNMSMTKALLNRDLRGFGYKSSGEAAQNAEMPLMVLAGTVAPEIVLPLMTMDSYARESQESFEELMEAQQKNGVSVQDAYQNAQEGAAIVGIASAAVEVGLERLLGGVETTASKAFHDLLIKDVAEKTTKMVAERGLAEMLKQGLVTQFRSSFEEGMEEILQQAIHNKALQKYDPDQKLTEGLLQSFEGGFFNWMNLLGGGGDILSNIQQNKTNIVQNANQTAYNLGERARNVVDNLNQGAYNAGANTRNILDNVRNRVTNKSTQGTTEVNQTTQQDNNQTTKEKENKPGVFERVTDRGAEKITSTASAQDKLYKAQEPRMNVLSNKKNLERRRSNSDRANELIVQNGYKPTNTAERLEAHQNTLNKLWKQVKDQVNQGEGITVDQTPIIDALSQYIQEKRALNIAGVESELKALEKELNSMKKAQKEGKTDLPILENKKQVFNDIIDWKEQEASEVYKGGIKVITSEIGKIEDTMLSEIPGQFSQLKRDVGALLDSYEDVFKADMKNQRSKGLGLTETYSRIEGVGDIIEGVLGVLSGEGGKVVKGAGKILLGKSLAKAKNVDFLIKTGFEELSNEMKNGGTTTAETTNTTPPTTPSTTPPTAPTQTSKNKVTSKKKSDSKNNAAKKTTKSVDKKGTNEYNTTDASSNTSPVSLTEKEEKATGTKSVVSEQRQGAEIQEDIPATFSKKTKTPTQGSNFDISGVDKEYSDNYDKIVSGELVEGPVGKIDGSIAFDGKERPAIFSQTIKDKIDKDHSLNKENLLGTIDKPDYIIKDFDKVKNPDKDKINLIRKIPGTNNFVLVAAERQNGFFILTNYEIHRNNANQMMKEIRGYAKRGIIALDTIGDLTEALNKVTGGKNAVTNKNNKKSETKTEVKEAPKTETKQEENKTTPMIKDSEGNTLSKEDQEKFGNSKIVDKDGNLLVVMHGSSNQETHDYYDETKAGSNVHADFKGVYFTDNLDLAEQFAHEQLPGSSAFRTVLGKRGHLYKSYVNITNPLNLNTATPEQLLPFFREDVLTKNWDEEKRLDNLKGHPQFVKFHVDMDKVEKAGYDGIIAAIGKEGEGNEYIVFKGNQAKNIGEVEAPKTEAKKEQPKNKVTSKRAKATTPKVENKVEEVKVEAKPEDNSDLRSKIGDKFYNYLQNQLDKIINPNRKENGLAPITIEEMLKGSTDLYVNKFEKIAQEEIKEIQDELSELTKDRPKAEMTEAQRKQLSGITDQNERNKLLKKWQDEWIKKNPISEEDAAKVEEIMRRGAEVVEGHKKARNYLYELEEAEENKEYEDKYSEQIEAEKPKKKESRGTDAKTRKKILAGDGVLIFSSGEFKFIPSLEQGLIRLTRKEGEAKLREQIESAFDDSRFHVNIWGDEDGNTYVYNEGRKDLQDLEEETTWETIINKENYKDFKLLPNGDIEFELDPDATFEGFKDLTVDLQDFLNNSRISRYAVTKKAEKEANNRVTTTEKNKITNTQPVDIEYLEEIDPQTLKILKDMGDKAAIKLYEEMGIEDDALEQLYLDMERERLGDNAPSIFEDEAIYQNNQSDNETAQIPTIFEEDLQESNLRNLEVNETAQTTEEEAPKNKVTAQKVEGKPKNLVTNEVVENNKSKPSWLSLELTDIFSTAKEQLKKAKTVSMGAIGKVQQTEVKLDNGTVVTYIKSKIKGDNTDSVIIRVYSPTQGNKSYVVTKEGNNIELREGGKILSDEEVSKAYDILQGKTGEVEVEDMKVDTKDVEDKKDPINAFLDNNETTKNDPKMKYKYLSRLNDNTSWTDYNTDIKYNGTVADKIQQTVDSFSKLFADLKVPLRFSKNNYGNYIEAGSPNRGMQSVNIGDDIEFEYAKFLYDNPEIRNTKGFKAEGLKEAIKKGNEIHKEVVKDAEELKEGLPLDPEKYVWQQPTAEQGIDAVYEQVKRISDFYVEAAKYGGYPSSEQLKYLNQKRSEAGNAIWSKLLFKSDRSKLYNDFITNIKEANGNEKQLRSIAKNLYIKKVKDDFKSSYNYPSEVTDKVPGLRTAKDDYERYLKGRDTSFSGKDPRIDYSDKDRIGAGIKRQDGNQITAAQRREIVNGVLEYAKYMGIDMKKMSEDAGVTYVHLNGKHPFLTSRAVGLFHGLFKSISVGADMESYREKEKGKGRDAKMETHTVPVVMAHEITHAIDSMFEWNLFADTKTREMARNMNEGRRLGPYWHSKEEVTARMVEEYVDVMKGGKGYYDLPGYWSKEVFDNQIKPYVEQIFKEKFDGYKLTDKERNDIKLDEAPTSKNTVTASNLNKVTNR